jgi:hypothetical protein
MQVKAAKRPQARGRANVPPAMQRGGRLETRPLLRARSGRGLSFLATLLGPAFGCASSGFDGQVFRNDEVAFRVQSVPESWRMIETEGPLLAFRDDVAAASIAITGRCGKDGDDVPLEALTHHLFINFRERQVEEQTRFDLDGREALHTSMVAELDGVPKRLDVVVLKKDGCVYDFFHIAPPGAGDRSRGRFLAFVRGFSTVQP